MYLLSALAAGLVRCIYIDLLDKLSEGIGGQLREGAVPLYPLNKLLYILCLLFLFRDLLLQTLDLGFKVFLFLGVILAHHGKAFIVRPTGCIVLVNADEKAVKLSAIKLLPRQNEPGNKSCNGSHYEADRIGTHRRVQLQDI